MDLPRAPPHGQISKLPAPTHPGYLGFHPPLIKQPTSKHMLARWILSIAVQHTHIYHNKNKF